MITKENVDQYHKIITHFGLGGKIQWNCTEEIWKDVNYIDTDIKPERYRIKPELKYRPFKNADEFKPYRDRWMRAKSAYEYVKAIKYDNFGITIDDERSYDFNTLLLLFNYEDGTPCGIQE